MNDIYDARIYNKNYKKKIFCCNCGKFGHKYSKCNEPITSLGIIALKFNDEETYDNFIKFFSNDNLYNLIKSNTINNNILLNLNNYYDKIKFLLIRRKKSLGYIEFIRGRYDEDDIETFSILFEQMTKTEIIDIIKYEFDNLWIDLWKQNANNKFFKLEYETSKQKFNFLKKKKIFFKFLNNINIKYKTPEWGFPKGRRIYLEKNINCACREFEEETDIKKSDYKLIRNIPPIHEIFYGTNNILYKHTYYFAITKPNLDVNISKNNENQSQEIGDIGWFPYKEVRNLFRKHHYERLKILNDSYLFFTTIISNNFKNDNMVKKNYIKHNIENDKDTYNLLDMNI